MQQESLAILNVIFLSTKEPLSAKSDNLSCRVQLSLFKLISPKS